MPEAIRELYPTPEELYAFFFAADALVAPPPGADGLQISKSRKSSQVSSGSGLPAHSTIGLNIRRRAMNGNWR